MPAYTFLVHYCPNGIRSRKVKICPVCHSLACRDGCDRMDWQSVRGWGWSSAVYVQCFLSSLGGIFPQLGLLAFRSVGSVWAGGLNEEGIGPPDLYIPEL